ncbi:hypothetical protein [Massilia luteola]|uniref:FimV/HubP-related protein n=1 Tax=Massilia luteola TaxID=3081751 RepID=UPI002ACC1E07|nr:hypothetical protein [Massilia sp. Gc5]
MARRSRLFLASLALAAFVPAHAAELGDPRVASHIGQPLVADVELTMLEDPATPVRVRVASPEVYDGAGIAMPPVLSSLNLSVMRRDGRQFLHVTSLRPVGADHVHLYLELVDKGDRAVRLATLWLTPDPNPAPAPAPARVAGPVVVPEPAAVPVLASKAGPVAVPEPAAVPARKGAVHASAPLPVSDAVLLAQVERARAAAGAEAPPRPAHIPARRPYPAPVATAPVARAPALPVAHQDAHPQACAIPSGEAQACAALGAKNDELRSRLGQVEDRMKKLQVSLGVSGAAQPPAGPETKTAPAGAVPAAAAQAASAPVAAVPVAPAPAKDDAVAAAREQPKPIVPAGPRPIHSIKPLMPHKSKAPPPDEGLPWGWIGAAIGVLALALGGAGAFVVLRRRRAGGVAPAAAEAPGAAPPGVIDKLKARFAARTRAPQAEAPERRANEPAEPTLE